MRAVLFLLTVVTLAAGCSSADSASTTGTGKRNGLIAFTRQHGSKLDQIYSIETDGSDERGLTPVAVVALEPVWSPDGRQIAFVGGPPEGERSLFVMSADGGGKRLIVRGKDPVGSPDRPSWSPDGRRLVFVGSQISSDALYVVRLDGSGLRKLAGDIGSDPAWSPDGKRIALSDDVGQIVLIDLRGNRVRTLTGEEACSEWPAWSPDGKRIAYTASEPGCFGDSSSIHVVDADGGNDSALTNPPDGAYDQSPAWSPDGQAIAFQRGDFAFGDVYVLDVDSGETTQVTRSRGQQDFDPSWQPLTGR